MGLDMYAYTATRPEADYETEQREIAYWRKHPNLHGWMEQLWRYKMQAENRDPDQHTFNGIEVELDWQDIDELEQDVVNNNLPQTNGFFFGNDADEHYKEKDLEFVKRARAELFLGLKVFYNSSW
jgi:hypothetical protein